MRGLRLSVVAAIGVMVCVFLGSSPAAHATGCSSAASVVSDIWGEWGTVIKIVGCAGVAAASGGLTYSSCYSSANKMEKAIKKMIEYWNKMAGNSWAKIGPRRLDFDTWLEGTIIGTTGRMFIAAYPSPNKRVNVKVTKVGDKGKAEAVVCKTDSTKKATKVCSHVFQPGSDNIGHEWKCEVKGAMDDIISVHIDGKSVAKSFQYKVRAKLIAEDEPAEEAKPQEPKQLSGPTAVPVNH